MIRGCAGGCRCDRGTRLTTSRVSSPSRGLARAPLKKPRKTPRTRSESGLMHFTAVQRDQLRQHAAAGARKGVSGFTRLARLELVPVQRLRAAAAHLACAEARCYKSGTGCCAGSPETPQPPAEPLKGAGVSTPETVCARMLCLGSCTTAVSRLLSDAALRSRP